MTVVLSLVLLVVVACVVLLFAMMGQLAARLPFSVSDEAQLMPLEDVQRLGEEPHGWPGDLSGLAEATRSPLVLVLSSSCASCSAVADELAGKSGSTLVRETGVVVSCGDAAVGRAFADRHGLWEFPCYIDAGGSWALANFGVQTSPTALIFDDHRLTRALVFTNFEALLSDVRPKEVFA